MVDSFNRMAQHLAEYRSTTLSTLLAHKKFLEAIINSISDPIIGLDPDRKILFINSEASEHTESEKKTQSSNRPKRFL